MCKPKHIMPISLCLLFMLPICSNDSHNIHMRNSEKKKAAKWTPGQAKVAVLKAQSKKQART